MKARLVELVRTSVDDGEWLLTLSTRDPDVKQLWDDLHDHDVATEIKKWYRKRSMDANAYFHALVNEIAEELARNDPNAPSNTEVKRELVFEYGVIDRDANGKIAGAKLPSSVDPSRYYEYCKPYATTVEEGKEYTCYVFYKQTRYYNTVEMARLIDGTIQEAKTLGIQTMTVEQLEAIEREWEMCAGKYQTQTRR